MNLKPCPFCLQPAYVAVEEYWSDCARKPTYYYGVVCKTSGCFCEAEGEYYFETEEEAIAQWNKRG